MKKIRKILNNQSGFTLVEMLIVIAVISILVLLVIPNALSILSTANEQGCEALNTSSDALNISNALTGGEYYVPADVFERVCD